MKLSNCSKISLKILKTFRVNIDYLKYHLKKVRLLKLYLKESLQNKKCGGEEQVKKMGILSLHSVKYIVCGKDCT